MKLKMEKTSQQTKHSLQISTPTIKVWKSSNFDTDFFFFFEHMFFTRGCIGTNSFLEAEDSKCFEILQASCPDSRSVSPHSDGEVRY